MFSLSVLAASAVVSALPAQQLERGIERVLNGPRVLYVAAHPDDENTRLLAWLVHLQGANAAYLSLTRGEGGQNLIGAEQAPLLGLIRTHELLAARRIDGAEQFFGRQEDFGFSKSHEEALARWGKERALADVVWVVRRFQPDVIVTRFSPEGRDTHGHHTASAILALEAFRVAADPKRFPEQLKWTKPWQAKRIVWNRGFFMGEPSAEEKQTLFAVDIGGYSPLLGESAPELAARSRSMHKSQGFGAQPQRGQVIEWFKHLAGEPMRDSFFDGTTRPRVAWGAFDANDPAKSLPALLSLPQREPLDALIAEAAGVFLDATLGRAEIVEGHEDELTLTVLRRGSARLAVDDVVLRYADGSEVKLNATASADLPENRPLVTKHKLRWPAPLRLPSDGQLGVGRAVDAPLAQVTAVFTVDGKRFKLSKPVVYAWNDPIAGERRAPLALLPAVSVNPRDKLLLLTRADAPPRALQLRLRATAGAASGSLKVIAPSGVRVEPALVPFQLVAAGAEQVVALTVRGNASGALRFEIVQGKRSSPALARTVVDYAHVPVLHVTSPAEVKLVRADVARAGNHIAYVQGAGDDVAACLRLADFAVTELGVDALESTPLEPFDAVVLGVRAFNTHARLAALQPRLLDYVASGGTLVVQYNTNHWLANLDVPVGPFPLHISRDRVTDETAPMTLALPHHPVWHAPNELDARDFEGWVQERGLYFADTFDPRYDAPLETHDPGEPARKGGLLVARHGKGRFVYTGLAFFRQLPAGVPGAYRLFANLLAREGGK